MVEMLRNGACTSADLTEHALRQIRGLDDRLHAFVGIYAEEARLAAAAADNLLRAGYDLGALHGFPVALKDNIGVRGRPSTGGSSLRAKEIATSNAWITTRLLECGAVIIGKTHMVEFALGAWGANELMGAPRNPGAGSSTCRLAAPAAVPQLLWQAVWYRWPSARIQEPRSVFRQLYVESQGSSLRLGVFPTRASCPSALLWTVLESCLSLLRMRR